MSDSVSKTIEGSLVAPSDARFVIVSSRFNELVVDALVHGAINALGRSGVTEDRITHVRVPGAWELSAVCLRLAKSGKFDAVIALGAVIRGATAHFDYVAGEAARGIAAAGALSAVPVIFGVLTTDTTEQAMERSGTKAGNKGADSALTAVEMVTLGRRLSENGL
jgi:6,7-dimethyl-8-ribityllumazine synthase